MSKPGQDTSFTQFNFLVDFGEGRQGGFRDMSGLDEGLSAIEYRTSRNPVSSASKMPGLAAPHLVTLKLGVIGGGEGLRDWHRAALLGRIEHRTIRVVQRDEQKRPIMAWVLGNARPTIVAGTGLKSDASEVAIETLEIACESIAAEG